MWRKTTGIDIWYTVMMVVTIMTMLMMMMMIMMIQVVTVTLLIITDQYVAYHLWPAAIWLPRSKCPLVQVDKTFLFTQVYIWSNYSDLTRPGPQKCSWGREMGPLISGKSRLVKYYNLARYIYIYYTYISWFANSFMVCVSQSHEASHIPVPWSQSYPSPMKPEIHSMYSVLISDFTQIHLIIWVNC